MGLFEWRAVYAIDENGEPTDYLDEIGPDGEGRKINTIEQDRLVEFQLIRRKTGLPHIIVEVRPGQKIIHRKRRFGRMVLISGKGTKEEMKELLEEVRKNHKKRQETIWVIGKHENRRGINIQQVFIVFQDGHVHVLDKWRDDFAPYIKPKLIPEEEVSMWKVNGECNRCGECCIIGQPSMLPVGKTGLHHCKYASKEDDIYTCEIRVAVEVGDNEFFDIIPEADYKYWRNNCENYPDPNDVNQMPPRHTVPDKCSLEVVWDDE